MEIEILKRIIAGQREEFEKTFREYPIIKRDNLDFVKPFLAFPNILAILGVRRSGKSVFSILLAEKLEEPFGYINFDDERLISLKAEDLDKILQAFLELYGSINFIILDEPQNVAGWELFVNRLRRTKKVIITGSNSNLLSGELATHLTGRYIEFTVYPFSFKEFLDFTPDIYLAEDIAKIRNKLQIYFRESGFPEYKKFGHKIVETIYQDIINKDCLDRYRIKNKKTFKELSNYLISNFSSEFTYSKLSGIFNIKDVHTVKNYVDCLKESFLIIVLDRFSPKLKQHTISPKKVYAIDHGICNFLSFKVSNDYGRIFENIVCIELLRNKSINSKLQIYYWKDYQQNEVDFVIKEGPKIKTLLQACYSLSELKTREREIKSLIKAGRELKCNDLVIISPDEEGEKNAGRFKIKFIPLWKWLLENNKIKAKKIKEVVDG
jgi:predicted AAA+ superfamily ATPase